MKKGITLLLSILTVFCFSSCNKEKELEDLTYSMKDNITSLDQQFVEKIDVQNILRGISVPLLTFDMEGKIIPYGASSYQVSSDGLKYTFKIRNDISWSNGTPLTAKDYAFGLKRLFTPVISPMAKDYLAISGAASLVSGTANNTDDEGIVESLGVRAVDEYTLEIILEKKDPGFLKLLSAPAAFPCNEAFFIEQKGRYAISKETTLSCGIFKVADWKNNILRLTPNENFPLKTGMADIKVKYLSENPKEDFLKGKSMIYTTPYREINEFDKFSFIPLEQQSYCLFINPRHKGLVQDEIRAQVASVMVNNFTDIGISDAYPTKGIFPPDMIMDGKIYRDNAPEVLATKKNHVTASQFTAMLSDFGFERIPNITISYPTTYPAEEFANAAHISLRNQLAVHTNLEAVTEEQIASKLQNGNYDIIIAPLVSAGTDYRSYIGTLMGIFSDDIDLWSALFTASTSHGGVGSIAEVEKLLVDESWVVPLYYTPSRCVYRPEISGLTKQPVTGLIIPEGYVITK